MTKTSYNLILWIYLLFPLSALAEQNSNESPLSPSPYYVGIKAGIGIADDGSYSPSDPNNTISGLYGGFQFNDQWAWDIGYQYHSELESVDGVKVNTSLWETAIRYDYGLTQNSYLYTRLGIVYWDIDKTVPKLRSTLHEQGFSPTAELGIGYKITPQIKLNAGYQYIHKLGGSTTDYYDNHAVIVSIDYRFSSNTSVEQPALQKPVSIIFNELTDITPPQKIKRTKPQKIILSEQIFTSLFDFDSSQLKSSAKPFLSKIITLLANNPNVKIDSVGHTDSTGSSQYNQHLSEQRAQAVANYLAELGLSASRINVVGKGETMPISTNDTAEGRAANRRVEIIIPPMELTTTSTPNTAE